MTENKHINIISYGIFILLLIFVFFFFNYNEIITKPPQSTHMWRQADCLSFTENLAQGDCDFFHMQTHHLNADGYTTGAGVSEAPLLYWFVAQFYKIFGYNPAIYRIINTLIFILGIFYLFKFLKILFKTSFQIYLIPVTLFASPVIAYYASNFLTDSTAFSLILIGWFYFFKFKTKGKNNFLYVSFLFFTIAGLLKILSLTSFVAIGIIYLSEIFTNLKFNDNKKIFQKKITHFLPFLITIIIIASWYLYAIHYNNIHNTKYFSNRILPVWKLSPDRIKEIFLYVKIHHFPEYYHTAFFIFTIATFIFNLIFFKKANLFLSGITFLLFISNLAIIIIWYSAFKDHDYYFINLIIFPVFNLITFFDILKKFNFYKHKSYIFGIIFTSFLIFLLFDAKDKLNIRYNGWKNDDIKTYGAYYEIKPYLKEHGITHKDTIISIGDVTNSYSLTAMNLKGWTQMAGKNKSVKDINACINKGAKYLFVKDSVLLKKDYLKPFLSNKIGTYKNVTVYKLQKK